MKSDIALHNEASLDISEETHALLRRLIRGEQVTGTEPGLAELAALGLAVHNPHDDRWSSADLWHAEQTALAAERAGIAHHLQRMRRLSELHREMRNIEPPSGNGIEFLDRIELVNAAIVQATNSATSRICTAHPQDRKVDTLRKALVADVAVLQRGVGYRTLYPDTARTRPGEKEWAAAASGHGAEIRTLATDFERMILVDNKVAVIADHRGEPNRDVAFKVTHPGMLAFFHHVYEQQWERAEPWMGGRFRRREQATLTTSRSRRILNKLREGRALKQIASELGVSLRTVNTDLNKLYEAVGVDTLFALGVWWGSEAAAKERRLD
ncbi:LuxR C-terminal-related transcriptional regulator [Streptomyces sp. 35G-GA-8]|uniref:LuxR C-terminal-related transcriptional regulator n=1 Tax=Streptomyces sp. 35G-GA-8 TaxID=2939434 RepID=UPI00201F976F|nr:LuxR C-terminal-related transcriptional regulator [Streptomyces sp. 35G-GA-8]MCL7381236.1 LuxR C-terminal-related transcriptional regulator [Streptomyces sp. 35G-GA-8]